MADAALLDAFLRGDMAGMKTALANGATKVNIKNDRGSTPLHTAVSSDDFELVKKLVELGADVNARTSGNPRARPISHVQSGQVAQYLVEHGATVGKDGAFISPLELSLRLNTPDVTRILLNAGASPHEIQWNAIMAMNPDTKYGVKKSKRVFDLGLQQDFCNRGVTRFCVPSSQSLLSTKRDIGIKSKAPIIAKLLKENPKLPHGMAGNIASYLGSYPIPPRPAGGKTRSKKKTHKKRKTLRHK